MNDPAQPQTPNVPLTGGFDAPPPPPITPPSSQSESDSPVPPAMNLGPTTPPKELFETQPVAPPPPLTNSAIGGTQPPPPPSVTLAPPQRRFPMKVLILFVVLLVAIGGLFAVLSRGLPSIGGKTTITWWGLWEDEELVAPIISEYQQSHPNVEIKYVKQAKEDYRERLTNALSRADGPDIFRYHNTWVPMFRTKLATIPASVMTAQEFAQTYYPVAVSDLTQSTGIIGMPLMYDGLGLYVNEEIFATYGKQIPTSWFEVRDRAVELTIKDDKGVIQQAGIALGRTENVDHWQEIMALMMLQNGVSLNNPKGVYAEQAFKFFISFSTTLGVWDQTLPNSTAAFADGKLAMYMAPSWRAHEIRQQNPTLKFRVIAAPQLPKERADEPDITYATYWVEGVNSQSKSKDASWEFLKFLSQKETLTKLYDNATKVRAFGELYPRRDMQDLLLSDPLTSGIMALAPNAKSWYAASRTFDGQTGINSQLSTYYENAINTAVKGSSSNVTSAIEPLSVGVTDVLIKFGLLAPTPAPKN